MFFFVSFIIKLLESVEIPLSVVNEIPHFGRRNLHSIALQNEVQRLYVGAIQLGLTWFNVSFDTGSTHLWVWGNSSICSQPCHCGYENKQCCTSDWMSTYALPREVSNSSSSKRMYIKYGTGWVSGFMHKDKISMAGIEFTDSFGVATSWAPQLVHCEERMDGILGLGVHSDIFYPLIAKSHLDHLIFSFDLRPGRETFLLGESPDPSQFRELHWFPLFTPNHERWTISSNALGVSSENKTHILHFRHFHGRVLIDSGTSYIVIPYKFWKDFVKLIRKSRPDCKILGSSSHNGLDCSDIYKKYEGLPDFWVNIGYKRFVLTPEEYAIFDPPDYIHQDCSNRQCILTIAISGGTSQIYVLGDIFMRKYYTIFDKTNRKIGLGSQEVLEDAVPIPRNHHRKSDKNAMMSLLIIFGAVSIFCAGSFGTVLFFFPECDSTPRRLESLKNLELAIQAHDNQAQVSPTPVSKIEVELVENQPFI